MKQFRIALAQMNPTVGALEANAERIIAAARDAAANGAQLVVFPELAVSGYPPEDLVLKRHFIEDVEHQVRHIAAKMPANLIALVGAPVMDRNAVYNAACVLHDGAILGMYFKMSLPNYGVFDEKRVFAEGTMPLVIEAGGLRLGVHVCEDSWSTTHPACQLLADARLDALINLSASPYHRGKDSARCDVLARTAAAVQAPLLYCNIVGGQDELVFDGRSLVIAPDGHVVARAATFREDIIYHDLAAHNRTAPKSSNHWKTIDIKVPIIGTPDPIAARARPVTLPDSDCTEVYSALALGLTDYVNKNGFKRVVVAISGGIDSALVATIAADALGKERVVGVTMPSRFSSAGTHSDARELAQRLGIEFYDVPIRRIHDLYLNELATLWPGRDADTTEENLQARIRGNIIMSLSNKFGWLVVTTGNKSELATGYCTLYGDMAGGFALIKDVPKTLVFELCRWRNQQSPGAPPIPVSTIDRPPSAELRDNQKDQDALPPYDVLDGIIERYVEKDWGAGQIIADGFDAATVAKAIRLIDGNEYKRRQGPPGVKITPKSFGRDRRLPITNTYNERVKKPPELMA